MKKKNLFEELNQRRRSGNEKILAEDSLTIKRFFALDSGVYKEGAIPAKYKELCGLVASVALRCNDCILYHLQRAIECGCSKEELNEALSIALVIGGSIVIPHLRVANQAMAEHFEC